MNNLSVISATSLITTAAARRNGFLEYALRRNKEAIPFIDKGKALKATLEAHSSKPQDILKIVKIRESLIEAAGISVKAKSHLSDADKDRLLADFIDKILIPSGNDYVDEIIYRYLLTSGDALGGKMRNIVGSIANEKFNRFVISQLQICGIEFSFATKNSNFVDGKMYKIDIAEAIKAIRWQTSNCDQRLLIYNINVPQVSKNIDIVLLNKFTESTKGEKLKTVLIDRNNYLLIGELKGGIDPAGADEHWKTANTALSRVRNIFSNLPLIFIGAAIESAMSIEIFDQYQNGDLANCANLTNDEQLAALCEWLVSI
jgi:Restriction endonuclease BsobI